MCLSMLLCFLCGSPKSFMQSSSLSVLLVNLSMYDCTIVHRTVVDGHCRKMCSMFSMVWQVWQFGV